MKKTIFVDLIFLLNVILLCLMMKPKGITTVILAGKQPRLFNEHIFQGDFYY